jgi:hypothetical protein
MNFIHVTQTERIRIDVYYSNHLVEFFESKLDNGITRIEEFYGLLTELLKPLKNTEEILVCDYENQTLIVVIQYGELAIECWINKEEHIDMNNENAREAYHHALDIRKNSTFCFGSAILYQSMPPNDMIKIINLIQPIKEENFSMYIIFKNIKILAIRKTILGYGRMYLYREDEAKEALKDFSGKELNTYNFN